MGADLSAKRTVHSRKVVAPAKVFADKRSVARSHTSDAPTGLLLHRRIYETVSATLVSHSIGTASTNQTPLSA